MKAQQLLKIQKKNKLILFVLICFILIRCKDKNEENLLVEYFPETESVLKSEYIIINDDTISHGFFKKYDKKDHLIAEGKFKAGKLDGKIINYYEDNSIESIRYFNNGIITGEGIYYNHKKKIEQYVLYNLKNEVCLVINFNDAGNYVNHRGTVFVDWICLNKNPVDLKVGDTAKYGFIIPNIPQIKKTFVVELLGVDNTKVKREITKIYPVGVLIKEKILKKGKNIFRGKVKLEFNNFIISDSLDLEYNINR